MSRRPRGTCPVCRSTLSLCWSGDVRVLRKHPAADEPCPGSGRPAVGEIAEITQARPALTSRTEDDRPTVGRSSAA